MITQKKSERNIRINNGTKKATPPTNGVIEEGIAEWYVGLLRKYYHKSDEEIITAVADYFHVGYIEAADYVWDLTWGRA